MYIYLSNYDYANMILCYYMKTEMLKHTQTKLSNMLDIFIISVQFQHLPTWRHCKHLKKETSMSKHNKFIVLLSAPLHCSTLYLVLAGMLVFQRTV